MNLIYRDGNFFKINKDLLSKKSQNAEVINGLYYAIYEEFRGAVDNPKYRDLNQSQKINELNNFAKNWLISKGYSNA